MERLLDFLMRKYGVNTPIFESTVCMSGLSPDALRQMFVRLVKAKKLARFSTGIYYIPTETPFGQSRLSVRQVVEQKYIRDQTSIWGYYTGIKLENLIGLTEQMPAITEIVTNREKARSREVTLGGERLYLRRPPVPVTSQNVAVLQFLDLMNRLEFRQHSSHRMEILKKFVHRQNIQRTVVREMLPFFPSKVAQKMICSGIVYELT